MVRDDVPADGGLDRLHRQLRVVRRPSLHQPGELLREGARSDGILGAGRQLDRLAVGLPEHEVLHRDVPAVPGDAALTLAELRLRRALGLGLDEFVQRAALREERLRALDDVALGVDRGARRVAVGHAVRVLPSVQVPGVPRHLTVVAHVVVRRGLYLAPGEGLLEGIRELGDRRGGLGPHRARSVGSHLDLGRAEVLQAEGLVEQGFALTEVRRADGLVDGEREVSTLARAALELLHGQVLAADGAGLDQVDEARGVVARAHGDHRILRELRALGVAVADDVVATWEDDGRGGSGQILVLDWAVAIGK